MARSVKAIAAPTALPFFRPAALTFLRSLARHNDRDWFQPRKEQFEAELRQPMLAVIRKVTDAMADFAPAFVRPAEKCIFRIYRDTRFSNNKLPYKTHVAAWWVHQGLEKTSGAGFYFHVAANEVIVAAGAYMPEKEQLSQIRHWLLQNHEEFRKLLKRPAVRRAFGEFEGNALTRPPKGFPPDHPALDLIRCRQWGVACTLPAKTALKKDLAAMVARYFRIAAPIVDALNTPIVAASQPKRKVLFGLR
jgi:uncharacterized protein (TIGR02453 family)